MLHISQVADKTAGVSACTPQLSHDRALWLAQLEREPGPLLEHLSTRPTQRLGLYFEQLWHFFLEHDPDTELIAHNVAVHEAGRTIGEFDCIYYCRQRDCHVHLELAVKYFLALPEHGNNMKRTDFHRWLGPDRKDSLGAKLDHLLHRQIRLGDTAAARCKLAELNIRSTVREIAFKGYLFQAKGRVPSPPKGHNDACTINLWMTCEQMLSHCAALKASAFLILPKMAWLSASQFSERSETYQCPDLQVQVLAKLANDPHPLLIAALDRNGKEFSRFFVTPLDWADDCNLDRATEITRI